MLFNSIEFAIFFPIVTLLYFLIPHKFRWALLLFASCFFYMFFKPVYILILLFTIIIDYYAGIWIARTKEKRKRKLLLLVSIIANVGILVVFKYYNFIAENVNIVIASFNESGRIPVMNILLPIGLSFHTFQAMSYTIEVYRGNQQPERHFGIYALYVMFYPQLVAGPIERPQNLIHQFHEEKRFQYENMRSGLLLITWGLLKKVVIADRLALFVNSVYGNPLEHTGVPLIVASVFFAFQIFCDFSGYSDIAIGSARCMGFDLMKNFERPYMSTGISEFWRRWHISLSGWFRDYVYIPLGGNRVSKGRWYFNILVVFALSGIWHGANWTFLVWGVLHGAYIVIENKLSALLPSLGQSIAWYNVLLKRSMIFFLVTIGWIFFRAQDISHAFYIVSHSFDNILSQAPRIIRNENLDRGRLLYLNQSSAEFMTAVASIGLMMIVHVLQRNKSFDVWVTDKPTHLRWPLYYAMVLVFIFFGVFNRSEFIYFQF